MTPSQCHVNAEIDLPRRPLPGDKQTRGCPLAVAQSQDLIDLAMSFMTICRSQAIGAIATARSHRVRRSGAGPHPGVDLELCVKSHGNWEVVDDDEVVVMPDKVIRCRFDLNHEVFAGSFYDVRWFRADDRGKLIEITRERFQLRNHSVGRRTGSGSQAKPRLAPKALPISEDEIKPRRLAPEAVASGDEISPRRAVEAR